ncbi:hypothetical protein ILUMI_25946 [Ignelater luminosus]|uniref:Adenylate cyclase-stimulating G alpha protein n=1 Tax=Ignelater luminosus TaxID=2038154 RepID=A0A8K0FZK6_IGNLU|nr:hypothetical protein ILUMI_25946 [Ignelater luminosus]
MSNDKPGGSKDFSYNERGAQNKIKEKIKNILKSSKVPFQKLKKKWMDQEEEISRCEYIIVCGPKCSGKSTIIKQLIWYDNKLCYEEKQFHTKNIRKYLLEIIFTLVDAMLRSIPTMTFDKLENENKLNYLKNYFYEFNCNYNYQFCNYVESIWLDKNVQKTFERKHELQLQENAGYFLDKIHDIKRFDYLPTEEDILHYYTPTTRAAQRYFKLNCSPVCITEIVNQDKIFFRKWAGYFENVKTIIFVVACDSYNIMSTTDPTKTKLQDSMDLFCSVVSVAWFYHKDIILFLNKQDLLEEKLLEGRYKFEDYFEDFKDYCPSFDSLFSIESEPLEVLRVKHFIRNEFFKTAEACRPEEILYTHFSSAAKRKKFNDILICTVDIIMRCNRCTFGLV